jgi:hypothetical protein
VDLVYFVKTILRVFRIVIPAGHAPHSREQPPEDYKISRFKVYPEEAAKRCRSECHGTRTVDSSISLRRGASSRARRVHGFRCGILFQAGF